MIYILKGTEFYLVQQKLNELLKDSEKDLNLHFYNGEEKTFNLFQVLEDCQTLSLFADKNYVVVRNPSFLIKKEEKKKDDEFQALADYIKNPFFETDLIFYAENISFLTTSKWYKEIAKNAQVFSFDLLKEQDFISHCEGVIKESKLKIKTDAIQLLIQYSQLKLTLFYDYLEILKIYPGEIDSNVIKTLFNKPIDDNIFHLINAITEKDLANAKRLFNDFKAQSVPVFQIIALLSNQLRHLYFVAYLLEEGKSQHQIAKALNAHPFRIQRSIEALRKIKKLELLKTLSELAQLHLKLTQDDTLNDYLAFELFLVKLTRNYYAIN